MKNKNDSSTNLRILAKPSPQEDGALARYNATHWELKDRKKEYLLYRVNILPPIEGQPDFTEWFEVMDLEDFKTWVVLRRLDLKDKNIVNLEDARAFVSPSNKDEVVLGMTAFCTDDQPHPAIVTAKYPFEDKDFSKPQILDIPIGKNLCFLSEKDGIYFALYRQEGKLYNQALTPVRVWRDKKGIWQTEIDDSKTIFFPKLSWANFRIGLMGSEIIPLNDKGNFILMLHGVSKKKKFPFKNLFRYASGASEVAISPDFKDIKLVRVGKDPLITYKEIKNNSLLKPYAELNKGTKEVIYSCGSKLDLDQGVVLPYITAKEKCIVEYPVPIERIHKNLNKIA